MDTIQNNDPPAAAEPTKDNARPHIERETRDEARESKAIGRPNIPYFTHQEASLTFGRKDSLQTVIDHSLQVAEQETLPTLVYTILTNLLTIDLPITLDNFRRMWRTILLKRVQDVYEAEKLVRAEHFVRFTRNITLPGPLGDLVHSIGYFHSTSMGILHHVIPPARLATPPPWWTVDAVVVANWQATMKIIAPFYVLKEFPSLSMTDDRPLMLTFRDEANGYGSVKSFTNEPKMTDALIRLVNDDLFAANEEFNFLNSHLLMTRNINVSTIRQDYVNSYVTFRDT